MANNNHIMTTYAPMDVTFERGEGCYLWDQHGKQYLDALSGIAVCGLGHAHPAVTAAISEQAGKLLHTSNLYNIENQQKLADALCEKSGLDRVFFSNSGAEANEAAIKIARIYGHSKNIKKPTIIVMENSFHGRTMATLSATGNRKVQAGFEPLVQGFARAPFNDIEAIKNIGKNNNDVVAVMVEPIQGEGGIRIPDDNYLAELRALCNKRGWLLILDEIQTGMGRTGQWFAYQHSNIKPDVLTLAKSLANGVPIGACLAQQAVAELMKPGSHGSTFGGNPLSCAAALAVTTSIEQDKLVENANTMGQAIVTALQTNLVAIDGVSDVRGKGLMIGIELTDPCQDLMQQGLQHGILFSVQNNNTIRLLPPITINQQQADELVNKVSLLVTQYLQQKAA